ncbi:hypothetical protein CCHL11_09614 [Colletotrichum chlorophyti]|uniref:Uncharacterized protein n=1 Tax=Colletotrichum chlorophyti TaxID=708187 RepID=A0A1Q8RWR3_9PEZI|nr:hypothetical protein CCHL11_09614 [Colletotrichum chlorophyti]
MILENALELSEGGRVEVATRFRPVRLTDSVISRCHFRTEQCSGKATSEHFELKGAPKTTSVSQKVERRRYYGTIEKAGMNDSPKFTGFHDIEHGLHRERLLLCGGMAAMCDHIEEKH